MDPSLPVLVTRLPDRRALARLVRAALRHEIAQVSLAEAPRHARPHTLDLRLSGSVSVSLLAEPAGAPQNGQFPLRLRPLHRAQAAELYALLESENVSTTDPLPSQDPAASPVSPPPDTIAEPRTLAFESDSAPIARAMSGSAPAPTPLRDLGRDLGRGAHRGTAPQAFDPRVTARLNHEPPTHAAPQDDPRRTVPSAAWAAATAPRREEVRAFAPNPSSTPDDPRRTAPSASWLPGTRAQSQTQLTAVSPTSQASRDGVEGVADASTSPADEASADAFAPRMERAALRMEAEAEVEAVPSTSEDPPSGDADDHTSAMESPLARVDDDDAETEPPGETPVDGTQEAAPGSLREPFFDDALMNLPPVMLGDGDDTHAQSTAPASPGKTSEAAPTPRSELSHGMPVPPLPDDDDDAKTLIRLPGAKTGSVPPVVPAARMPARSSAPPSEAPDSNVERGLVPIPRAARIPREELTPTDMSVETPRRKTTTGGRKRKTTRSRKVSRSGRTKHPADQGAGFEDALVQRKSDAIDPLVGRRIADGKYTIESLIGSGAAGAVYKTTHRELRRTVAIKVLHPHYQQDPHFMKGFRGEALAASQLDHPNVMRVLDFGQEPDGLVYIVMEFLSGRTLQSLLDEERRLPPDRAVEIMIQVCAALSVAHDNGIIHRDIKPDNIMLVPSRNDEGGTFELVKVCDFGIAALENPRAEDAELGVVEGVIAGTPEYMSPEQARGGEVDPRADVYACGICLYELVTGRPPFLGENAAEILVKQCDEMPRPPSQLIKGLDSLLEEIILRSIQKDPSKRHQSARELRLEMKELIDPSDARGDDDDNERSIVENVPGLDDPASGFPGFFILLSSAVLRVGRFERGHPDVAQAMKDLQRATKGALRGRRELTFARRDTPNRVGFCVMSGHAEIVDLKRLLGSQMYGSHALPIVETLVKKGIAAMTLREGIPDTELGYLIEMLLGPYAHEELRKELFSKPLRCVSVLFVADVVGRDRKLSWKVGLCAARLARDLRALSNVRGISLKRMRELRDDLVTGVANLLTKGEEVRQFLFNADLVDDAVANLRGFSAFQVGSVVLERLLHEPCAEAAMLLLADFDRGDIDRNVLTVYLRAFAQRLIAERSPKSDQAVADLYRRGILSEADVPRDLVENIHATSLADALVREPSQFLRTLDLVTDPADYRRELLTLEAAMAVLARRAEAGALLAVISVLARHAKGATGKAGARENHALRTMKSMIDKQRLLPIANALLTGPPNQREAARQLLVLAGSAGAHALYIAREGLLDATARPVFVQVFRETGPAGWSLLSAALPQMHVHSDADVAMVEDLLRAMPDRPDPVLAEAVAKFLGHPKLRATALSAIVPLWGDRAKKPLMDALEFAEEPARIVAMTELRRIRAIDDAVVAVIERLLTMRGSASDELRATAAGALADAPPTARARAITLLVKGVEGKRGVIAMLRGDGANDESLVVTEAMARALLALDRAEGTRAIKARIARADAMTKARLAAVLQHA